MFEYFNPHPKGLLVGDCVKRAIVAVTSEPYQEVARSLNAFKKQTGVEKFNDYPNPQEYVQECLGAHELTCDPIRVADFCKKHPQGKYILETSRHWTACVNGKIYDTWDPSEEIVETVYQFGGRPAKKKAKKVPPIPPTNAYVYFVNDTSMVHLSKSCTELRGERSKKTVMAHARFLELWRQYKGNQKIHFGNSWRKRAFIQNSKNVPVQICSCCGCWQPQLARNPWAKIKLWLFDRFNVSLYPSWNNRFRK